MTGDAFLAAGKGALIGGGIGALTGAFAGMADALVSGKNVWLGRDIAMGRSAWSFSNTDLEPTSFWEDIKTSRNTTRISDALKQKNKAMAGENSRWYRTEYAKDGYSKLVENPISIDNPERTIYVGNMKGRGELVYSGWVENGFQLQYTFDGNTVITLPAGNYSNTIISIPSGTKYINIRLTGSLPSYLNKASMINTGFFKTIIYGIPK